MEVKKIKEVVDKLPSNNIYELLYYDNIHIIDYPDLLKRKCESMIISNNKNTAIFMTPDLLEEYKQFLLWHEYGHYKLHYDPNMKSSFYLSRFKWKSEHEANVFAALALLKDEFISEDTNVIDLMVHKGIPKQIVYKVYDTFATSEVTL